MTGSESEKIYHITAAVDWQRALELGAYTAPSLESEGFIHFSKRHQVLAVANSFYRGLPDMVLLEVDPAWLTSRLQYDPVPGAPEPFPHLYGPLNLEAVVRVHPFPADPETGLYAWPEGEV
ncbi:MAG TPA: DUF952 domain-containing protein [Chloroflexi bacterium]|nr:DUF952 domain-containing protein [Chloroflexota bacterium]